VTFGKVEVTGGAALLLALLYYLDDSGVVPYLLLSCLVHEGGHWWAIRVLGGEVRSFRLSCGGAVLVLAEKPLPPQRLLLVAGAGPCASLALAWVSANLARFGFGSGLYLLSGLNLGLALFNLLPAAWLDGGVILESVFTCLGWRRQGEVLLILLSEVLAGLLLGGGVVLLWESGGARFSLLLAGLWALRAARRERGGGELQ